MYSRKMTFSLYMYIQHVYIIVFPFRVLRRRRKKKEQVIRDYHAPLTRLSGVNVRLLFSRIFLRERETTSHLPNPSSSWKFSTERKKSRVHDQTYWPTLMRSKFENSFIDLIPRPFFMYMSLTSANVHLYSTPIE